MAAAGTGPELLGEQHARGGRSCGKELRVELVKCWVGEGLGRDNWGGSVGGTAGAELREEEQGSRTGWGGTVGAA